MARAAGRSYCDYAFYIGGCAENADLLAALEKMEGCAGVKVFMGSSTGALLAAEDDTILKILQAGSRRLSLHAGDENRLRARKKIAEDSGDVADHPKWRDAECASLAVRRALHLARQADRPIHILHATSADEMAVLRQHRDIATVETTPQHLTLCAEEA